MNKRVLLLFLSNQPNAEEIIISAKYLQNNFNFEITPLYIRDINILISPTFLLKESLNSGIIDKARKDTEDKHVKKVDELLKEQEILDSLIIDVGVPEILLQDYLKMADLVILGSDQNISEQLTDILEIIYKPVFIIKEIPLMLNKIALASDDGIKINKSLFSFMNIFPKLQSYNILAYNSDMKQSIFEVFKYKNKEFKYRNFSEMELLYSEANRNTCLIMGNLSKSYFFKKITKRKGLDIIENIEIPIFIG
ncbi:MAG: hypothetical protein ACRC0W_04835 [Cetobacterium sp.]